MQPPPDDTGQPRPQDPLAQETVELGEAARVLGLSAQALWAALEQEGLRVLRLRRGGLSCSALTRVDFDRLRTLAAAEPDQRGLTLKPGRDVLDPLMERVRAAENRSSELEAGVLEMHTRLAQSGMQVDEARQRMGSLRRRFEAELAAANTHLQERWRKLERAEQRERGLARQLVSERAQHGREVEDLRAEHERLVRELDLAQELERANAVYLDRLERKARRTA